MVWGLIFTFIKWRTTNLFIYINADKADSTEELAGLVAEEYDVPKSEVLEDVKAVVKTLQQKGILL